MVCALMLNYFKRSDAQKFSLDLFYAFSFLKLSNTKISENNQNIIILVQAGSSSCLSDFLPYLTIFLLYPYYNT